MQLILVDVLNSGFEWLDSSIVLDLPDVQPGREFVECRRVDLVDIERPARWLDIPEINAENMKRCAG